MSEFTDRYGINVEQLKEQIEQAMLAMNIEQLVKLQDEYVKPMLNDEDLYNYVDVDICLYYMVYEGMIKEQQSTGSIMFLESYGGIKKLKEDYYEVKKKLRYMDYLKDKDSRTEAIKTIVTTGLSDYMVIIFVSRSFHNLGNVYTQLCLGFYEAGVVNRIVPYMEAAIGLEPKDKRGDIRLNAEEAGIIISLLDKFEEKDMSSQLRQYQMKVSGVKRSSEIGFFEKIKDYDLCEKINTSLKPTRFSFIICVSDNYHYEQALWHINHLIIPDGCSVNVVPVRNAESMCAGYNEGIRIANKALENDVAYNMKENGELINNIDHIKIFIHQDVFIVNSEFLYYVLGAKEYYPEEKLGLLGVCGTIVMPETGVWWDANLVYARGSSSEDRMLATTDWLDHGSTGIYERVECVDGICLVTFEDIPFREDLFDNWHFYDVSACMEYHRAGYTVAVIRDGDQMLLHQCKFNNFNDETEKIYDRNCEVFLSEYSEDIKRYSIV